MQQTKPTVRERLRIALNVFRDGYPRGVKQAPFMWPAFRGGVPQWQITDFNSYCTDGFQRNSLIYEAIMYKVRSTWYTPLRAYNGDVDHPEVLPLNYPLAALAHRPNAYQSTAQFMGSNTVYLNITGNSYVMLDRPKKGALPTALYPLRPDRVYIIPDDRAIKGYVYVPEGRSVHDGIPILPEDMIHVRLPNPLDPLEGMGYGLSPFAAMSRSADVDNAITDYLKIFFQRGAAPNLYLSFDVPMDDTTIAQVKRRFMEIYGGYEKWVEPGVMDQGGEIKSFGSSFKEMAFRELDYRNESRITGPFGVPLTVLNTLAGMSGATYSNKETDRRIFWEDTMIPELGLHEADYQLSLVDANGSFVAFDTRQIPALKKDKAALSSAFVALVNTGVSKNKASSYLDMDLGEFTDGDTEYMPQNLMPIGKPAPAAPLEDAQPAEGELTQPQSETEQAKLQRIDDLIRKNKEGLDALKQMSEWMKKDFDENAERMVAEHNQQVSLDSLVSEAKELAINALRS